MDDGEVGKTEAEDAEPAARAAAVADDEKEEEEEEDDDEGDDEEEADESDEDDEDDERKRNTDLCVRVGSPRVGNSTARSSVFKARVSCSGDSSSTRHILRPTYRIGTSARGRDACSPPAHIVRSFA